MKFEQNGSGATLGTEEGARGTTKPSHRGPTARMPEEVGIGVGGRSRPRCASTRSMALMTTPWTRLCTLIDDDAEVRDAVELAAGDPAAFLEAHRDVLAEIGVTEASQIDPWLALIDALDDAGALAYLESGDGGEELADALAGVPRVFRSGVGLDEVDDVGDDLDAAIRAADRLLEPHGLRIAYLDEGTDDVPLVVVPRENAEELVAVAAGLGRTARVYG